MNDEERWLRTTAQNDRLSPRHHPVADEVLLHLSHHLESGPKQYQDHSRLQYSFDRSTSQNYESDRPATGKQVRFSPNEFVERRPTYSENERTLYASDGLEAANLRLRASNYARPVSSVGKLGDNSSRYDQRGGQLSSSSYSVVNSQVNSRPDTARQLSVSNYGRDMRPFDQRASDAIHHQTPSELLVNYRRNISSESLGGSHQTARMNLVPIALEPIDKRVMYSDRF